MLEGLGRGGSRSGAGDDDRGGAGLGRRAGRRASNRRRMARWSRVRYGVHGGGHMRARRADVDRRQRFLRVAGAGEGESEGAGGRAGKQMGSTHEYSSGDAVEALIMASEARAQGGDDFHRTAFVL